MDKDAKAELVSAIRQRYGQARKKDKSRILDEFVAITGHHRKYALRLLTLTGEGSTTAKISGRRIYGEAVSGALVTLWEASDRLCGKRLKAILPKLLESLEAHGHLELDQDIRQHLLTISAATIDRLLRPYRTQVTGKRSRRPKRPTRSKVNIKTFSEWVDVAPGNLEIDFVAHCGGNLSGSFIHSFVATDVASGWTESVPLLVREQSLVVHGLASLRTKFPIPIIGINSDNDSAFINESLIGYCETEAITFTRSRAYHKNDQAWIEQKNGSVVRRFLGYSRFAGPVACQAVAHLYELVGWYVNIFQPSFKLKSKSRNGCKVKKNYLPPKTPCDRLLSDPRVSDDAKTHLAKKQVEFDPLELLHQIRQSQSALTALSADGRGTTEQEINLEQFLAQLPKLWEKGEARPTRRNKPTEQRTYRTRKDPFEGEWAEVLGWLEKEPDVTAAGLLERLTQQHPDKYHKGHLRTLQRRIGQWRHIMARQLVFGAQVSR